ncbi:MAG: flavin-containing monooxygenase, partial [Acidimicrobiales bacterium]
TTDGRHDKADYVIAATGVLHHPSYPDIEGLDTFEGTMFHTARWNHDVSLEGKRVGIVGTGSTAVQVVTAIVDNVGELNLFQRTPQWVLPMENTPIEETDKERYRADPSTMADVKNALAQSFENNFASAVVDKNSPTLVMLEQTCRANIENHVSDPELRAKLTPDYRAACKRLIIASDFYEKIQRPNANLITEGIEAIEPGGVRTKDGELHELDILVLATGFRVDQFMRPIQVTGRSGIALDDVWAKRPSAYLAVSIPEFPNLFMLNGPNGPVGNFSLIDVAELQFNYIMQLVEAAQTAGDGEICATHEAAEKFEVERTEAAQNTVWVTGCRSWYLDDRGVPAAWPWGFDRFRAEMAAPKLTDYELV